MGCRVPITDFHKTKSDLVESLKHNYEMTAFSLIDDMRENTCLFFFPLCQVSPKSTAARHASFGRFISIAAAALAVNELFRRGFFSPLDSSV